MYIFTTHLPTLINFPYESTYKIVFLGNIAGKTSLISQSGNQQTNTHNMDFVTIVQKIDNQEVLLQIWDTESKE